MIVILCALFPEAAPLIQKLCLARDTARTPFPRFWNQGISLYLSGPGEIAAAACTGFALGREETLSSLHLVNFGSAAGPENRAGELFLADALLETGTGRRFYPDLVLDAKIPEAAVRTCQKPADRDTVAGANDGAVRPVLFDMEAAAICDAAMHFLGPDRIHFLKFVSDAGGEVSLTQETLLSLSEAPLADVLSYLSLIRRAQKEEEKSVPAVDEEALEKLSSLFCCSVAMKERLSVLLHWCALSGRDFEGEVKARMETGVLPAPNRREGKKVFDDIERTLTMGD